MPKKCHDCNGSGESAESLNARTQAEYLAAPACETCNGEGYIGLDDPGEYSLPEEEFPL